MMLPLQELTSAGNAVDTTCDQDLRLRGRKLKYVSTSYWICLAYFFSGLDQTILPMHIFKDLLIFISYIIL